MIPSSWKSLTSSKLSSIRDYVAQKDYRGAYDTVAARIKGYSDDNNGHKPDVKDLSLVSQTRQSVCIEKLHLFPGWAVRRFQRPLDMENPDSSFSLEIYVSGFASSARSPETVTRSQKAFYHLAKTYAALPKLSTDNNGSLKPKLNGDDFGKDLADDLEGLEEFDYSAFLAGDRVPRSISEPELSLLDSPTSISSHMVPDQPLRGLHDNLDARIKLFWTTAIANRMIHISIFCPFSGNLPSNVNDTLRGQETDLTPLATTSSVTSSEGFFEVTVKVPWERLATHPPSLHVTFGDRDVEYPIVVQAEMWPPVNSTSYLQADPTPYTTYQRRATGVTGSTAIALEVETRSGNLPSIADSQPVLTQITIVLPVQHVPIRLISDIDDTVKHTGVVEGAKAAFRTAFTRNLSDLVIPYMVTWYRELWHKGVRFHYVSNSPFELLPIITEFFRISNLPEGSIRLKSYKARALLSSLLSPAATRKRQGVIDVLNAFSESVFLLVGDSGEQDLELYTELARERPHQIAGIFIRNVTIPVTPNDSCGIFYGSMGDSIVSPLVARTLVNQEPQHMKMPSIQSMNISEKPDSSHLTRSQSYGNDLTPEERKMNDFICRIERARADIPSYIVFKVFKDPVECGPEVENIFRRFR